MRMYFTPPMLAVFLFSCSYYHDTPMKNDLALKHANVIIQLCGNDYVSTSNVYKGRSFHVSVLCKKTKPIEIITKNFSDFISKMGYTIYYGKIGDKYVEYCFQKTNLQVSFAQNYLHDKTLFKVNFFYSSNRELNCSNPA